MKKIKLSIRALARKHGYRSGLEDKISEQLKLTDKVWSYESEKLKYTVPERLATYTPDFVLIKKDGSKMYIESKGYWPAPERKKIKFIIESNPELDIRMLFQDANTKISKKSKTTYGNYAEKIGIQWASYKDGFPLSWLDE